MKVTKLLVIVRPFPGVQQLIYPFAGGSIKSGDSTSSTGGNASSLSASMFLGRPPGINQAGPIPGFAAAIAAKRTPVVVHPDKIDLGGLKDSLAEQ